MNLTCFKAYDIRGKLGVELDETIAYRIGRAYGEHIRPRRVAVGSDVRLTSEALKLALANGLMDSGADVVDLGLTATEEVYFAAFHLDVDGGIEVTASHNPLDYNGMKLVRRGAQPISGDSGLHEIRRLVEQNIFPPASHRGTLRDGAGQGGGAPDGTASSGRHADAAGLRGHAGGMKLRATPDRGAGPGRTAFGPPKCR